jgi:hypothetical protein
MIELLRGVGDNAQRAGGDGLFYVAIAVGRAALHGDKNRAGLHFARVVLDAGYRLCEIAARPDGRHFFNARFFPVHHVIPL